jgi:hypothetical protein
MARILTNDLVTEYLETIKNQYPELTFEQCKEIVSTPYKMLSDNMKIGGFKTVRMKYLGTFVVYPKRAKAMLDSLTKKWKKKEVYDEDYFKAKLNINKFLNEKMD